MALPIKPKDTQEGCNPISSNCVIWQGPDIPCINLCNGDSVSDVVAKLAEELCTIVDQLDISILDISCFGALAPEPADFRDVIQLLISRVCNLEANSGGGGTATGGCPDDCLIPVAQCLQFTDPLGNVVTELVLRDYMILIANRICTIISQISALSSSVVNIEGRLTVIEQTLAGLGGAVTIDITSSNCVGNNITQPIQAFVLALETTLCNLIAAVGTQQEITNAIARQCTPNNRSLDDAAQLSNPGSSMANIPGWAAASSYTTLADAVNNLWLTICDMRVAIEDIQATLATCCSVSCDDVNWNFTATGLNSVKFINLYFTGNIPAGFDYCNGATTAPIVITNSLNQSFQYSGDVVNSIQTGASIAVDLDNGSVSSNALWYIVRIPLCVTDGTNTCQNQIDVELYNSSWCSDRAAALISTGVSPTTGNLTFTWEASLASTTQYQIRLFSVTGGGLPVQIASASVTGVTGSQSYAFGTFTQVLQTGYYVVLTSIQGTKQIECTTSTISLEVSP